jgi:Zn-dependent peptidase ImmA (M78 family)
LSSYDNYENARNAAWTVILDCELSELPIDLKSVTKTLDIRVMSYDDGKKIISPLINCERLLKTDGFSIVINNIKAIYYNDGIHSIGQRRFTIAHEIGHLVLGHNTQGNIKFRYSLFNSENAGTAHPCEIVANVFARNLLMPTVILKEIGLHTPREIMQACNVSYRSASVCAKRMRVLCKHNEWKTTPLEMKIRNRFMPFIERFRKIRKNP